MSSHITNNVAFSTSPFSTSLCSTFLNFEYFFKNISNTISLNPHQRSPCV